MNALLIGSGNKNPDILKLVNYRDGFLLVDDFPEPFVHGRHTVLDFSKPRCPRFNILKSATDHHKFTQHFTALLNVIFPEGATTLTKAQGDYLFQNGLRLLLLGERNTLMDFPRLLLDKKYRATLLSLCDDAVVKSNWEHIATWKEEQFTPLLQKLSSILMSPLLRRALCAPVDNFELPTVALIKLDRAVIGELDAFILGTLFIGQAGGTVVIPDFGFFGRDFHTTLIRQNRLIAGLSFLNGLPVKLQQAVLTIDNKTIYKVTREDAERLIFYVNPLGNPNTLM